MATCWYSPVADGHLAFPAGNLPAWAMLNTASDDDTPPPTTTATAIAAWPPKRLTLCGGDPPPAAAAAVVHIPDAVEHVVLQNMDADTVVALRPALRAAKALHTLEVHDSQIGDGAIVTDRVGADRDLHTLVTSLPAWKPCWNLHFRWPASLVRLRLFLTGIRRDWSFLATMPSLESVWLDVEVEEYAAFDSCTLTGGAGTRGFFLPRHGSNRDAELCLQLCVPIDEFRVREWAVFDHQEVQRHPLT
jgi:hypothetical protein